MLVEATPGIQVEELVSLRALEGVRPEWEALWAQSPDATPFQSPQWLMPWWKHFGGPELWCLALRNQRALVGFAPLFIWESNVWLIGTGITDYLDVLINPEWRELGVSSIYSLLVRQSYRWELCDFQQLRANSPLLHLNEDASIQDICPVLNLRREIPMLKKAQYHLRHAAKFGNVRIEAATAENFEALFSHFLKLQDARWRERSVVCPSALQQFHAEVVREFLDAGMLRLYVLYLDAHAIAAWYGVEAKGRLYFYLGGFDPEFEKLSPGTILTGHAIEQAIAAGATELDFLRGQERYKYSWGARDQFTYRMRFRPSSETSKVATCGHS